MKSMKNIIVLLLLLTVVLLIFTPMIQNLYQSHELRDYMSVLHGGDIPDRKEARLLRHGDDAPENYRPGNIDLEIYQHEILDPEIYEPKKNLDPEIYKPKKNLDPDIYKSEKNLDPEIYKPEKNLDPDIYKPENNLEPDIQKLANQDPVEAWNYLKEHTADADSVFYNFDPTYELRTSINGSYFNPLPGYKNRCWIAEINNSNPYGPTEHPAIKVQNVRSNMQQVFARRLEAGENWRMRCFPYTMLIGMSKCGTSNLFKKLTMGHPEIFPSAKKETWFWGRFRNKGKPGPAANLTYFMDYFDEAAEGIRQLTERRGSGVYHPGITMEGTPHYLWDHGEWDMVPGNIGRMEPLFQLPHTLYALAPQLKLIIILRNPTDRQYSMFRMLNEPKTPEKFHENVELALELWEECRRNQSERRCTYDHDQINRIHTPRFGQHSVIRFRSGMYHVFVADWLKVFPRSQVLILRAEDYYRDAASSLSRIFKFLGVSELSREDMDGLAHMERGKRSLPMFPKTRAILDKIYQPANVKLAELLDDSAFMWR